MLSERKKIKLEKEAEECKLLIKRFSSFVYGGNVTFQDTIAEMTSKIRLVIGGLKIKEVRTDALQIITDLLATSTKNISSSDVSYCFLVLFDILKTEKTDISILLNSGIASLLEDDLVVTKYFEYYPKSQINREGIRELVAILIENSNKSGIYIDTILAKYDSYKELVPRLSKLIDFDKMDEERYIQIISNSQHVRDTVELRVLKGKKRLLYVENIVKSHLDFVLDNYIRDRDKRIRLLLAQSITVRHEKYYNVLLNDPDEDVRACLISSVQWDIGVSKISSRLLDKSAKVRELAFEVFRKGILAIRGFSQFNVFEKDSVMLGKLEFKREDTVDLDKQKKLYEDFENFVEKICEGCLTGFLQEYIKILTEAHFSLDFLCEHSHFIGMPVFLKTMVVADLDLVKIHLKSFVLKYIFKGILRPDQISDCIAAGIFEVLNFIPDPLSYYPELLEKAMSSNHIESVEKIAEFLSPILSHKSTIFPKVKAEQANNSAIDDSGVFKNDIPTTNPITFEQFNYFFLNAHTKTSEIFNEHQMESKEYPNLYFQAYKAKNDIRTIQNIKTARIDVGQKIKLLLYINNADLVTEFSDLLICYKLDYNLQRLILETKNMTSTLIYFLCTGLISVTNSAFFTRSIKCCLKLKTEDKVKEIFKKYINAVPQKTFDLFYSICWELKRCSITADAHTINQSNECKNDSVILNTLECDESLIMTPMITENTHITSKRENLTEGMLINKENEQNTVVEDTQKNISLSNTTPLQQEKLLNGNDNIEISAESPIEQDKLAPSKDTSKVVLRQEDKMLYFICNSIIAMRTGDIVPIVFDAKKYGFSKLSDLAYEMIGHGNVTYL